MEKITNSRAKAYKEVYEILKYVPEKDLNKIPKELLYEIEENKDDNYIYEVETGEDFNDKKMLPETKNLLAYIFRNYWATEEQIDIINKRRKNREDLLDFEKRQIYNPDKIFNNKLDRMVIDSKIENSLTEVKESFFEKIINFLKNLFNVE